MIETVNVYKCDVCNKPMPEPKIGERRIFEIKLSSGFIKDICQDCMQTLEKTLRELRDKEYLEKQRRWEDAEAEERRGYEEES